RITDKSSTLIDFIYTNCPERVVCSGVAHISISDHSLVYAFRKLSINFRKGHTSITNRNFKTFHRAKFRNDICNENWEFLAPAVDPSKCGQSGKPNFYKLLTNMLRFTLSASKQSSRMIRKIGPILKECVTKLILKLKLLTNYFTIISLPKLMATRVKCGKSSTILHLVRPLIYRLEK
ncbi:unnamed protein product, partial [Porites evermanni]